MKHGRGGVALALFGILILAACPGDDDAAPEQVVDQRARDSALAESGIRGSNVVGRALDVSDSAAARAALIDSLSREP